MKNKLQTSFLITFACLTLISCKKVEGPQGPQGPAGTNANGFMHTIGELYEGGIIAYMWKENNVEHGLIASLDDLSGAQAWSNVSSLIGSTAQNSTYGQGNTTAILSQNSHSTSAAALCDSYSAGGFSDWYLPAQFELNKLNLAVFEINSVLDNDNNPNTNGFKTSHAMIYWSSTEDPTLGGAWSQTFGSTISNVQLYKTTTYRVRAVRRY